MTDNVLVLVDLDPIIDSNPYSTLKKILTAKHPDQNIIFWGFPQFSNILQYNPAKNNPSIYLMEDIYLAVHDFSSQYLYIHHCHSQNDKVVETIKKIQTYDISFFKKYYFTPINSNQQNYSSASTNNSIYIFIDFQIFNFTNPANIMAELLPHLPNLQPIFIPLIRPAYTCNIYQKLLPEKFILLLKKDFIDRIKPNTLEYLKRRDILVKYM